MSWSSLRRRWPEAVLIVLLGLVAVLSGLALRAAALVLVAAVLVFAARRRLRDVALAGAIALLVLALAVVATLTIDLGSVYGGAVKTVAERQASKFFDRPTHIGRLGIHLASGRFVVENFKIEGITPDDIPFFTAKQILVGIRWGSLLARPPSPPPSAARPGAAQAIPDRRRELVIESVDMTDWEMTVQKWGDRHNFVKLGQPSTRPRGQTPIRTTVALVRAMRGQFSYVDHGSWTTIARNLEIKVSHATGEYRGIGSLTNGMVQIRDYAPMRADMNFSFKVDKGIVDLDRIDMITDGAVSKVAGSVDLGHWPEQTYRVDSRVNLWRMREIFFADQAWRSRGDARFTGTFHLFKGGHQLAGKFSSPLAFVNQFAFPDLRGSLVWEPARFEVLEAQARPYGGDATFSYSMKPLGDAKHPTLAKFDACYRDVDLGQLSDAVPLRGVRMLGRLTGCNLLEYPLGHFALHRGGGQMSFSAPAGVALLERAPAAHEDAIHAEPNAAGPEPSLARTPRPTPIGGRLVYRYDPDWVDVEPSYIATDRVYVEFEGRTAYGDRSRFPFYARAADWQEGDRLLAGIITAFGSPTGVINVGGWGEFQGTMTESFKDPRIEGTFRGDGMRAWDVVWGRGQARVVIQHSYVDVTGGIVRDGPSEIRADGRFSLGFPRKDGGEEIDARVTIKDRPLKDLRHAFELDDWPVDGVLSGEYHLSGKFTTPIGFGNVALTKMTAWREPFDGGTCTLRFEGPGVRVDELNVRKGGGAITGAAYVAWAGTYSFSADGHGIPLESIGALKFDKAPPLSGVAHFKASGASTFLVPKWELSGGIDDIYLGDEGVGLLTGRLEYRDRLLTISDFEVAGRLGLSGVGQVEMTDTSDANLSLRFTKTTIDPFVRALQPKLSPFTRAEATGTIRVVGQLADPERLLVDMTVEDLAFKLFDYELKNDGPIRAVLDGNVIRLGTPPQAGSGGAPTPVVLVGNDTRLELSGSAGLGDQRVDVRAVGDANLAILQAFFKDIRSSGRVRLVGGVQGPFESPALSGEASITDGRMRYLGLPHSIQNINGRLSFGADGIQLEDVKAQVAGGNVRFGGRIGMNGLALEQLSLTATGDNMQLRYPEGFRSVLDAQLDLVGTMGAPTLKGEVTVRSATYRNRIDVSPALIGLASGRAGSAPAAPRPAGTLPLRFDVQINAPSALRIDTNLLRMVASADLRLRGDLDRPALLGRAEVERGEAIFEGKRYLVTSGTIDFTNPTKIEPYFDISAETRVRAPGQTYIVDIRLAGTLAHLQPPQFNSDPPLPPLEIMTLLFGDASRTTQDAELRAVQGAGRDRASLAASRLEQALVGTALNPVTSRVERAAGLESFQITPNFYDPYQRVTPTARLTVGKRISDKVYITLSRSINTAGNDLIVLIEYDQSQKLSWVLSRNEDNTYALDVRVRHVF
jgi:hypothetical protein